MKKIILLSGLMVLCMALFMSFPNQGKATELFDSTNCRVCHEVATPGTSDNPDEEHNRHPIGTEAPNGETISCASCHQDGVGQAGNVHSHACTVCHLEKCESVNEHDPGHGATCLSCHVECKESEETTTTTVSESEPCAAEAVYGENSYEVWVLKAFRDDVLAKTAAGRSAIKMYYKLSPMAVTVIEENETFKNSVKKILDTLIPVIETQIDN